MGIRNASVRAGLPLLCLLGLQTLTGCSGTRDPQNVAVAAGSLADPSVPSVPSTETRSGPVQVASLAPLAKQVTPAVVAIQSLFGPDSNQVASNELQGPFGSPQEQEPTGALGTGFIVSSDGYILTNNHVVENATRVTVGLPDRRIFTAKVIGHDPSTDVALIKIDATNLPTLPLGDDSTTQVGDAVMAVGNPLGLNFTVTSGIVSAKGRSEALRGLFNDRYAVVDFIQTDAVINPGNSGGPLVDMNGRVIGINSAIASPTGTFTGYGFAVPISIARIVMEDLRKYGRVRHAILGIVVQDVTPADARAAGLQEIQGVLVGGISSGGPAAKGGVHPGDIITAVNGHAIDRVSTLQRMIFGFQPGATISLEIHRYGKQETAQVTLGEPPSQQRTASKEAGGGSGDTQLGIGVTPITPELAGRLQLPTGTTGLFVLQVDPTGPAASAGLAEHDIIEAILGPGSEKPVRSVDDLRAAASHAPNGVVSLLVFSTQAGGTHVVNIQVGR